MTKDEQIILSGKDILVTDSKDIGYALESGRVNVFVTTLENGRTSRRVFLCELSDKLVIPSLCCRETINFEEEEAEWRLIIAPASDTAELLVTEFGDEDQKRFCEAAGVENYELLGFEEALLEAYRLKITEDIRSIYAAEHENAEASRRTLLGIFNLFRSADGKNVNFELTQNHLYNAASAVCQWMKINYVPLSSMISACGRQFSVQDFARVSGFACREILLTENWYKQDAGPILAFMGDEKLPVACIPKGSGRYVIYRGNSGESMPLTKKLAESIKPNAYMFYRPFPRKKMNLLRLALFSIKDIRASDIFSIVLFAFLGLLVGLLVPYINEKIYDVFIPIGDVDGLVGLGAVIIACTTGNLSFSLVQSFCGFRVTNRMKYSLNAAAIDRLFNLPESFYGDYDSAELAKRTMSIAEIFSVLANSVISYGFNLIFSALYLFKIFQFEKKVAWAAIIMLTIVSNAVIRIGTAQIPAERLRNKLAEKNGSMLYQMFTGVNKLRIFGAEERGLAHYMKGFTEQCSQNIKSEKYEYTVTVISTAASTLFSIVFFFLIVKSGNEVSIGKYMGFSAAFGSLADAVLSSASHWMTVNNIIPYYEEAKPILETLPEKEENVVVPTDITGEIQVDNLTFGYDPDQPVINGISFSLKPGEYVGIVGGSGCGKSTLLRLLLGFEKPQEGRIYYDGQDLESVDKRELRKKFGVVLQDGGIIAGSIYDNISISKPTARLKEIKEAVRAVGLEDDIKDMPMGLHTVLSEGSGGISGGQKQRILIARAIVAKPNVLFLDEATSALDNNIQNVVCESLANLNATRIVIAHRLSTIMNCDRIFVLDHGKIVEEGNYEQLMALGGMFYELARRQIT